MLKIIVAVAAVAVLVIAYICFRIVFYVPEKNKGKTLPLKGDTYKPYLETMKQMREEDIKYLRECCYRSLKKYFDE